MNKTTVSMFNSVAIAAARTLQSTISRCVQACIVVALLTDSTYSATITSSPTAPATNGFVIANLAAPVTGTTKWYTDVGAIGQTFLTGSRKSLLTAVTLQTQNPLLPETRYVIRLGTVSNTTFTVVASETATQTVAWAGNDYMTFTLNTPVLLTTNTLYGFDIGFTYSSLSYDVGGIPYMANSDNTYSGGALYSSGVAPGVGTNTITLAGADRIFHLAIEDLQRPCPDKGEILPAGNVALSWSNLTPTVGSDVWVDVWFGTNQAALAQLVTKGLNTTNLTVSAPVAATYYWRVDSYLNGAATGTPETGTLFNFVVIDTDSDGLPDTFERAYTTPSSPTSMTPGGDADSDGLTNLQEYQRGTNPIISDTDGDGLSDGAESNTGTWVSASNTGTNPLNSDTDGDGLSDGVESNTGTWYSASNTGTSPLNSDTDSDGLSDGVETRTGVFVSATNTGTSPHLKDTDADGAGDWYEVTAVFTDPNNATSKPKIPYPLPDPDGSTGVTNKPVKVFIMSGQSNMVGFGTVNGTDSKALSYITRTLNRFPNLIDSVGNFIARQDVKYRGVISALGNGPLAPGFGASSATFGPELGFGQIMGWHFDEPVLLIKSSIGNRSLAWDVLPRGTPSWVYNSTTYPGYGFPTPAAVGDWYAGYEWDRFFMDDSEAAHPHGTAEFNVVDVLDNFATQYPGWAAQGFEIAGFVWWQGDKDRYDMGHATRYETNLVNLITELRTYYSNRYPGKVVTNAPFVLATLGQTAEGDTTPESDVEIFKAQRAVDGSTGKYPLFDGNVKTVYAHPLSEGGASNSHYDLRAGTYMLVGDALGRAMYELLTADDVTPPTISTLSPADNATGVGEGVNLVLTFSEPVALGTGNITLKNLTDATQTTIAVTDATQVSVAGSVLTINPTADLLGRKNYAIQIAATAIKDMTNNAFVGIANDTTWNFTTWGYTNATLMSSQTQPPIGADDLANYGLSVSGDKWFYEDSAAGAAKGQTFTTGNAAVLLKSLTYQTLTPTVPTKTFVVRVGTVAGSTATFTPVATATFTQTVAWAANDYVTWTFATPILLQANTVYGIDVGMTSSSTTWETGIPYLNITENVYPGGALYNSGTLGVGTTTPALVGASDRIFHIDLDKPLTTNFTLVATSPADNATKALASAPLSATFSRYLTRGTGNITLRNLTDATDTVIPINDSRISIFENLLTINPGSALAWSKNYAVRIDPGALVSDTALSFEGITDDTTWNFTTAASDPLLTALGELKSHITGAITLTAEQIAAHKLTIAAEKNRFAISSAAIAAAFDLVATFDSVNGHIWSTTDHLTRSAEVNDLTWTIYHVMQDLMDLTYTATNIANFESLLNGFTFGSSSNFPGPCAAPADSNQTFTATLSASYADTMGRPTQGDGPGTYARKPTGCYLAPGSIATVTVPQALVGKNYRIRVGANAWDYSNKPYIMRLDRSTLVYSIDALQTKIASPLGGGIYIEVPWLANAGVVSVQIKNAVRSPYFSAKSFHQTTLAQWLTERAYTAPWADFQSDKFMMQVPTRWISAMPDPTQLMADWDAAMDAINDLMGFPRIRGKESIYTQVDQQIKNAVFAPGYPSVNVGGFDATATYGGYASHYLVRGPQYGVDANVEVHEQGHGYFFPKFGGESEATVNLLYVSVLNRKFGKSLDEALRSSLGYVNTYQTLDTTAMAWMCVFNFSPREVPMDDAEKAYQLKGHAKFVDIARLFGWSGLDAFWNYYNLKDSNYETYPTDNDSMLLQLCKCVGKDIRPLFHFWGLYPSNPVALRDAIVAAGIPESLEIRDALLHYKTLVPANNAAFRTFAQNWWGHQPTMGGYWEEREHARQWDTNAWFSAGDQQRADITINEMYVEACATQIVDRVQEIIEMYFGTGSLTPTTTTLVSSPATPVSYGTTVTLTATVMGGPASGTVTFWDETTVLGTTTLSSSNATFATSSLPAGTHSLTATYNGDTFFAGSMSAPLAYSVTAIPLTISGVVATNKVYDGTASATLSGGTLSAGVLGGETVTIVPGIGTFASANVGTWAVTASAYSLGGAHAGNYTLSAQPTVANASITPRPVVLGGSRVYDATTAAGAGLVTIANNVDGANLTLTGSTTLAGQNVGTQAVVFGSATPARVQSATGNSGGNKVTSFGVTLSAAPTNGNTLIAVISTRGSSAGRVTGITQNGATWSRAAEAANAGGTTTEIWYAPNVSNAVTGITINQASLRSAAVVMEYSGILTASPVDRTANSTGNNANAVTGTTPTTTQANELWIGGIGLLDSTYTLGSILNSFDSVASAQSTRSTVGDNAKIYALQRIVTATATANSGGTVSTSSQWSGALATFKAAPAFSLGGSAAGNYTLTGVTGSVTVTAKPLTLTGTTVANKIYDATTTATLSGGALQSAEAPGAGTTSDGKPYTGDTVTPTLSGAFNTKEAGDGKAVTSTSTLGGAQAGNYTLTQPEGLTANITPKALTLTGATTVASKLYDGTTAASLSGGTLQSPEAVGSGSTGDGKPYTGDTVTLTLSGSFVTKDKGTGKAVTSTSTLSGVQAGDYSLTQPTGLTADITASALTVTANNQFKTAGQTLPFGPDSTQFTSSGLQNGETIGSVTLSCLGGDAAAGAGTYSITASAATGGTFDVNNYTLSYVGGTLTVTTVGQTITFGPLTAKTYGDAPFGLTATASSGLTVIFESSDPLVASVAGNTVTILKGGTTTITALQPGDATFGAAAPVAQALTVNPASQTITFDALPPKTYGDAPFELTATASSGMTVTYASSDTNVADVVGSTVTILKGGTTTIIASQAGDARYSAATPVPQSLTVNPTTQTITFGALEPKTYGDAPFSLNGTASSDLAVSYTSADTNVATVVSNLVTILNAGITTITATQAGNSDYDAAAPVPQTLTVAKVTPIITWNSPSDISYGTPLSSLQLNATSGGVAGSFDYTPPAGTVLPVRSSQTLHLQFTPTDTANYNTPAPLEVTINAGATALAEDFEEDWADNALVNTTNGWVSGAADLSTVTNLVAGYTNPTGYNLTPLMYDHRSNNRVLRLNTEGETLKAPFAELAFTNGLAYLDLMANLNVNEEMPVGLSTQYPDLKVSIFLLAQEAATNLVVYHGTRSEGGFGEPAFTMFSNAVAYGTWRRVTLVFDATTDNGGAEAFRVLLDGKALVSADAYGDAWKTRVFGSPTPDGGTWFLSAARRTGSTATNLASISTIAFKGDGGLFDDLVATLDKPNTSVGTVLMLAFCDLWSEQRMYQ